MNILEVKNLDMSYKTIDGEVEAVKDVSFSLKEGVNVAENNNSSSDQRQPCHGQLRADARPKLTWLLLVFNINILMLTSLNRLIKYQFFYNL